MRSEHFIESEWRLADSNIKELKSSPTVQLDRRFTDRVH